MSIEGQQLADELGRLFGLLVRAGGSSADDTPTTSTQRLALVELTAVGPMRLGELAQRIGSTDPTASRAVDGLCCAGLVERRDDPDDRRAVQLAVTRDGRERVERWRHALGERVEAALCRLEPEERAQTLQLVARLNEVVDEALGGHTVAAGTLLASR